MQQPAVVLELIERIGQRVVVVHVADVADGQRAALLRRRVLRRRRRRREPYRRRAAGDGPRSNQEIAARKPPAEVMPVHGGLLFAQAGPSGASIQHRIGCHERRHDRSAGGGRQSGEEGEARCSLPRRQVIPGQPIRFPDGEHRRPTVVEWCDALPRRPPPRRRTRRWPSAARPPAGPGLSSRVVRHGCTGLVSVAGALTHEAPAGGRRWRGAGPSPQCERSPSEPRTSPRTGRRGTVPSVAKPPAGLWPPTRVATAPPCGPRRASCFQMVLDEPVRHRTYAPGSQVGS